MKIKIVILKTLNTNNNNNFYMEILLININLKFLIILSKCKEYIKLKGILKNHEKNFNM